MAGPAVKMYGVATLQRELKELFAEDRGGAAVALKGAGREAAEPVLAAVRERLPHKTGALAGTLRVTPTKSGATIRLGTRRVPYAGPTDFGGWPPAHERHSRAVTAVFKYFGHRSTVGGRRYVEAGRYLFPAARDRRGEVVDLYSKALQVAIDGYPWRAANESTP